MAPASPNRNELPVGDSEAARLVRCHDWASSPLGAIERWSPVLRSTVEMVLAHGFPSALLWGSDLIQIYNDGYRVIMGNKHPAGLGQATRDCWPEIWDTDEPFYERIWAGETRTFEDKHFPITRSGASNDARFTLAFSPVRENDAVAGVLVTMVETTGVRIDAASDIAGRKHAEEALGRSEQQYRTLFESLDEGFYVAKAIFDEAGSCTDILYLDENPAARRMTGQSFKGHRLSNLADYEPYWREIFGRVATTGRAERLERYAEPDDIWYDFYIFRPAGAADNEVAVVFHDVSKRKRAEMALRESEERQAFLLKLSDALRTVTDPTAIQQIAMQMLAEKLNVSRAFYFFVEEDGDSIYHAVQTEHRRDDALASLNGRHLVSDFHLPLFAPLPKGDPVVVPDIAQVRGVPDAVLRLYRAVNVAAFVNVPVMQRGRYVAGVGAHEPTPRDWQPCEIELLREVADRTWSAIERARAEAALHESDERLRQFGEASQDVPWIRDAETLQWVYLTPAFETIYGLGRDKALSEDNYRNWLDLVVSQDRESAHAAMQRVRAGEHVTFDYRIERPSDGAIRWMRNTDFPIRDAAGRVALIGGIGHDATELRQTELRFRTLVEGVPQLVWRAVDAGKWTWSSPQWTEFTGLEPEESLGLGWLDALHPDDRAAAMTFWEDAEPSGALAMEGRLRNVATGDYRWFQTRATPVRDEGGTIIEWLGTSTDIDDLRRLQEQQKVLVAELQHRTRNLIGVVRSMADKTAHASSDLSDFRARFRDRLQALARVQGLLSRIDAHDRVTFDQLIDSELSAMDGGAEKVTLQGPGGVRLRSSTVQTLAMALHELATNALKYGALGQPSGQLAVTWSLDLSRGRDTPWLHVDWRESGIEMVPGDAAPQGSGQGRELIEKALPYQLGAKTTYELHADGVHCTISMPVSASTKEMNEHG